MALPIALIVLALLVAAVGALYVMKRRLVDHERPPDLRPNDPRPTNA
jgi:hypothetical protein